MIHPSDMMDAKKKDLAITVTVVAIVAALMAAMVWMIFAYSSEDISEDAMYMLSAALSGGLFFVVIIYAVYTMSGQSASDRYRELFEDRKDKKQ